MQKAIKEPTPPAERMRLHRIRRRNGLRYVQVLLADAEVDTLVARGFLKPDRRHSQKAIQDAVDSFICHDLGPPENQR
jgi:hypothetical protein